MKDPKDRMSGEEYENSGLEVVRRGGVIDVYMPRSNKKWFVGGLVGILAGIALTITGWLLLDGGETELYGGKTAILGIVVTVASVAITFGRERIRIYPGKRFKFGTRVFGREFWFDTVEADRIADVWMGEVEGKPCMVVSGVDGEELYTMMGFRSFHQAEGLTAAMQAVLEPLEEVADQYFARLSEKMGPPYGVLARWIGVPVLIGNFF